MRILSAFSIDCPLGGKVEQRQFALGGHDSGQSVFFGGVYPLLSLCTSALRANDCSVDDGIVVGISGVAVLSVYLHGIAVFPLANAALHGLGDWKSPHGNDSGVFVAVNARFRLFVRLSHCLGVVGLVSAGLVAENVSTAWLDWVDSAVGSATKSNHVE